MSLCGHHSNPPTPLEALLDGAPSNPETGREATVDPHAADGKRVFRADGPVDVRVDHAAMREIGELRRCSDLAERRLAA